MPSCLFLQASNPYQNNCEKSKDQCNDTAKLSSFALRRVAKLPVLQSLIFLFGLLVLQPTQALEQISDAESIGLPTDFSKVHFYLITIDVGNSVWDNFGHTALRMVDENSNIDSVLNWGLFDMSGGMVGFSFNFFKGIMNYQLGSSSPQYEFDNYRRQQRSVWQDKINLNNRQKEILYKRLVWNLRPENITYPYQYFTDNCTTRVRDYLDEALLGAISEANSNLTQNTYRDLVNYHYESIGLIELSLDVLMNSNIDRRITQWEEMFLPLSLRSRLMNMPSDVAVGGEQLDLLSESTLIMEFEGPGSQVNPYYVASASMLMPVLFLFLFLRKASMSYFATHSKITFKAPGMSFRLLGILGFIIGLFSGIYGCMMLGGWFFSGHVDLYNNVNLLLFWPTDLLGAVIALRWLALAKPWPLTHNTRPFLNYYLLARIMSILAYVVVAGLELSTQELTRILIFLVPGLFLFTVLVWMVGFEEAKPKNMFI